jgi:hypothetical protein
MSVPAEHAHFNSTEQATRQSAIESRISDGQTKVFRLLGSCSSLMQLGIIHLRESCAKESIGVVEAQDRCSASARIEP